MGGALPVALPHIPALFACMHLPQPCACRKACIVPSLLLNASPSLLQISQFFIGVVVLMHYPLNHFPARAGMHDVLNLLGIAWPGHGLSVAFTLLFVGGSVAVAMRVHSLGDALSLIGGACTVHHLCIWCRGSVIAACCPCQLCLARAG